jgi:hypothetical protein
MEDYAALMLALICGGTRRSAVTLGYEGKI